MTTDLRAREAKRHGALPAAAFVLELACALLASYPAITQAQLHVGRVASRGVVRRTDDGNLAAPGQGSPTWVQYLDPPDGPPGTFSEQKPLGNQTIARMTDATVRSVVDHNAQVDAVASALADKPADSQHDVKAITPDQFAKLTCLDTQGVEVAALSAVSLAATTRTVVVRTWTGGPVACTDLVKLQVQTRPDDKHYDTSLKTLLISPLGEVLATSVGIIGYETNFMLAGLENQQQDSFPSNCVLPSSLEFATQAERDAWRFVHCRPGSMYSTVGSTRQLAVWAPIFGAHVEIANFGTYSMTTTNEVGYYELPYQVVGDDLDFDVDVKIAFQGFGPRSPSRAFFLTDRTNADGQGYSNFPVEIATVAVSATFQGPQSLLPVSLVGFETDSNGNYANLDQAANATSYVVSALNSSDTGLLQQINVPDVRDSDLYVYRVADGRLIGSRWGLFSDEIPIPQLDPGNNIGTFPAQIAMTALIRGPASKYLSIVKNAYNSTTTVPAQNGRAAQFGVEVDYDQGTNSNRNAYLRDGDVVKLILINRATGYIATQLGKVSSVAGVAPTIVKAGQGICTSSPLNTDTGKSICPLDPMVLRPPNLKLRVRRSYEVEGGGTKKTERNYVVGFEGSGLTSDATVIVETEWYDADGSALPTDLPGYTGRLAKTVLAHEAGGSGNQVTLQGVGCTNCTDDQQPQDQQGLFSIAPGFQTHVIRVGSKDATDSAHFYIHIDGEPEERNVDFTGRPGPAGPRFDVNQVCYRNCDSADCANGGESWSCVPRQGAGPDQLSVRPSTYVPFLNPSYNAAATASAKQQAQNNHQPVPDPIYDWHYRPEMQFTLFDLDVSAVNVQDKDGNTTNVLDQAVLPDSPDALVQILYTLQQPDVGALPSFTLPSGGRSLDFVLGTQTTSAVIQVQGQGTSQAVAFAEPTTLQELSSEDFLTIRLVQQGDEGNVLWEYEFTPIKITLEGGKRSLKPGNKVRALAQTIPAGQPVWWSSRIDPVDMKKGVKAEIDRATGLITVAEDSEEGWLIVRAELQEPTDGSVHREERIKIGCECEPCNAAGNGNCGLSSIDVSFGIGRSGQGETAGNLVLRSEAPTPDIYTPKALEFTSLDPDVEALYTGGHALRQVSAPESFLDVQVLSSDAYELHFYMSSGKGAMGDDGFYQLPPYAPDVTWRVENPVPGNASSHLLRLTETRDGHVTVHDYQWSAGLGDWSLIEGNGLTTEQRQELSNANGDRVVRVTKQGANGTSSVKQLTFHTYSWGEELVQEVVNPDDPGALTTQRTYYEDAGNIWEFKKIQSIVNPDGSWVRYQYEAGDGEAPGFGQVSTETRSWLDASSLAPEAQARAIHYDYTPLGNDTLNQPGDPERFNPRTITETILGTVVAVTHYAYARDVTTGERTEIEERCSRPNCGFPDATSLRTETHYYGNAFDRADDGKVKSVLHPDGTLDSYSYDFGAYDSASATFSTGTGKAIRQTITHGTSSSPLGVPYKTTRDVSITDERGRAVRDERYAYTGGGYELLEWTRREYDAEGHVISTTKLDGEHATATWGCCAEDTSTDSTGITTVYSRDDLQRVTAMQRAGISTTYSYDADGRELTATRSGGGLSLVSGKSYDPAGRLLGSTDENGLQTSYEYALGGRQTTVTRPGGFTEQTDRFIDGQQRSVTGTAVVAQYFSYSVNGDGTRVTEVHTGSPDSPVFERTITDMLGRTVRVERPGFGGTTEVTQTFYNNLGQVARTSATGLADTLYEYDEVGQQTRTGLDVNGNGQLDLASADRITESNTHFELIGNDLWQTGEQSVYADSHLSNATRTSTNRNRITGRSDAVRSEQVAIDLYGNETNTRVSVDPGTRTETRTVTTPDSNLPAVSVSVDGRLASSTTATGVTTTFDYDGLGRRIGVTDARTGRSETHYDTNGFVDFVKDAAGNPTTFVYDEQGSGRKLSEQNALGKLTYFEYDARGELIHTWGDVPYPVEYVYDQYGRRTEMHTFRSGSFTGSSWPGGGAGDPTIWHYEEATGLLSSKEDAAGKAVTYTYGPAGRLATRTWARTVNGVPLTTTYGYDPATGELLTVDYTDSTPDVTYGYDRLGRQGTVTDGAGSRTFAYDPQTLQLTTETMTGLTPGVLTHKYEAAPTGLPGRAAGLTLGSYDVTYGYDSVGRFGGVSWNANGAQDGVTYSYVPNGALLAGLTSQSGQATTYAYEPKRDLKTQVMNRFGSTVVSQYDYAYDVVGRRTSVKNSGTAFAQAAFTEWGYDDRNQVTASNRYNGSNLTDLSQPVNTEQRAFAYDPIGNRQTATAAGVQTAYTANELNEYTAVGASSPSYDDDGNLVGDGSKVLAYNGENQLKSVTVPGVSVSTYDYDYLGRRVRKSVTVLDGSGPNFTATAVYSGWNKVEERKTVGGTTTAKNFVWGLDLSQSMEGAGGIGGLVAVIDQSRIANLFSYDGNGNVSELINARTGVTAAHYEYDASGNTASSNGVLASENCYRFSTKDQDDETGLVEYGYRYLEPPVGRWISQDPIADAGGLNLYNFVANDPPNLYDLLGRKAGEVGLAMMNGFTDSENNWFQAIAFRGAGNSWERTFKIHSGADALDSLAKASGSCPLNRLTWAGHGWARRNGTHAAPQGPGLPGPTTNPGSGLYLDTFGGLERANGGRSLNDLRGLVAVKKVQFAKSCEIQIYGCRVGTTFAANLSAITGCSVVAAHGGSQPGPGKHPKTWVSGPHGDTPAETEDERTAAADPDSGWPTGWYKVQPPAPGAPPDPKPAITELGSSYEPFD